MLKDSNGYMDRLRALALGNANAKYKGYLTFQIPKCIASGNTIAKYYKFFCKVL